MTWIVRECSSKLPAKRYGNPPIGQVSGVKAALQGGCLHVPEMCKAVERDLFYKDFVALLVVAGHVRFVADVFEVAFGYVADKNVHSLLGGILR